MSATGIVQASHTFSTCQVVSSDCAAVLHSVSAERLRARHFAGSQWGQSLVHRFLNLHLAGLARRLSQLLRQNGHAICLLLSQRGSIRR